MVALAFVMLAVGRVAAQQPPDNVQGNWTIYSKNIDNGETVKKFVQINENGNRLTGHFKGPNQSGGIEGMVNVHHIEFSTKTRNVLTFRGQVDGNRMSGMYGIHGRHAEWRAVRNE
ncbi:MAG TPA: hypothetical protein VIX90_00765 [Edaphobacter sp.]